MRSHDSFKNLKSRKSCYCNNKMRSYQLLKIQLNKFHFVAMINLLWANKLEEQLLELHIKNLLLIKALAARRSLQLQNLQQARLMVLVQELAPNLIFPRYWTLLMSLQKIFKAKKDEIKWIKCYKLNQYQLTIGKITNQDKIIGQCQGDGE